MKSNCVCKTVIAVFVAVIGIFIFGKPQVGNFIIRAALDVFGAIRDAILVVVTIAITIALLCVLVRVLARLCACAVETTPEKSLVYDRRNKHKYSLRHDVCVQTKMQTGKNIAVKNKTKELVCLRAKGLLKISAGYAWDGPSRIPDTRGNLFASLVHDSLYQLMRHEYRNDKCKMGGMTRWEFRKMVDELFYTHWSNNGGSGCLQYIYVCGCYHMLRCFGESSTLPPAPAPAEERVNCPR